MLSFGFRSDGPELIPVSPSIRIKLSSPCQKNKNERAKASESGSFITSVNVQETSRMIHASPSALIIDGNFRVTISEGLYGQKSQNVLVYGYVSLHSDCPFEDPQNGLDQTGPLYGR